MQQNCAVSNSLFAASLLSVMNVGIEVKVALIAGGRSPSLKIQLCEAERDLC